MCLFLDPLLKMGHFPVLKSHRMLREKHQGWLLLPGSQCRALASPPAVSSSVLDHRRACVRMSCTVLSENLLQPARRVGETRIPSYLLLKTQPRTAVEAEAISLERVAGDEGQFPRGQRARMGPRTGRCTRKCKGGQTECHVEGPETGSLSPARISRHAHAGTHHLTPGHQFNEAKRLPMQSYF